MNEFERIAALSRAFETVVPRVELGIGDDAAVLIPGGERLVWTVDAQVDGVHFRTDVMTLEDVGYRAMMASASDLAAMGAKPWCALAAWVLPDGFSDEQLFALARGAQDACARLGAGIVGGNLARGGELSVTTTWLGACVHPVSRRGARAGDGLFVAGALGLAAVEREALFAKADVPAVAMNAWRRPLARVTEGIAMAPYAHAAIDVSDGLAQDVGHLARASGVRAVLDFEALTATSAPLRLVLEGGEDYALVVAAQEAPPGFIRIGRVDEGEGVWIESPDGLRRLEGTGFDHFANAP